MKPTIIDTDLAARLHHALTAGEDDLFTEALRKWR